MLSLYVHFVLSRMSIFKTIKTIIFFPSRFTDFLRIQTLNPCMRKMANRTSGFEQPTYSMFLSSMWILIQRVELFKVRIQVVTPSVYCFGFLSNIIILWIFSTDGLASTSNINFFSLGVGDLSVCIFFLVAELFKRTRRYFGRSTAFLDTYYFWRFYVFPHQEAIKSFSVWITALFTLERLLCITFPMKVSCYD